MTKSIVLALAMVFVAAAWMLQGTHADASKPTIIRIRITEEGEKSKKLLDTSVQMTTTGKIEFIAGGELRVDQDDTIQFGTQINGIVKQLGNDTIRVSLRISLGNPVGSDEATTQVVRFETLELRAELALGIEKRIHCGGARWCEILVQ